MQVVLLEFWATWCGFCETERPFVERVNEQFGNKGLLVLAVDVGESKKTVKKYLTEPPRKTRVILTEDNSLAARYAATSYLVVAIDREGNIVGTQRGAAGEASLRRLVDISSQPFEPWRVVNGCSDEVINHSKFLEEGRNLL